MAEYRSIKERYGHSADLLAAHRRRHENVAPPPDPFRPPVTRCPRCGRDLVISPPGYKEIEGLRMGACPECNIKAALVERINPIWRQGDRPDILEVLRDDMIGSERDYRAHFGDASDPEWSGATYR